MHMTSTPLEISQEEEPTRPPSTGPPPSMNGTPQLSQAQLPQLPLQQALPGPNNHTPVRSTSRIRRLSNSSNRSSSSVQDGYTDSDMESGGMRTDNLSVNELRELYRKQDRALRRYKQKFSEVRI